MQTAARREDAGVVTEALRQGRTPQPQEAKMSSLPTRNYRIGSKYHRGQNQLPACYFSQDIEKTYDRSISNFIRAKR